MYLRILKKDMKRKKTMNVILLLFVVLATMFSASSINNIIAVTGGIDSYLDKAGIGDYVIIASKDNGENNAITDILDNDPSITEWRGEEQLMYTTEKLYINGDKLTGGGKWCFFLGIGNVRLNFFDSDNDKLAKVKKGEVYITTPLARDYSVSEGDEISFTIGERKFTYKIAGIVRDALLGSGLMNNPRMIMNDEDYADIMSDADAVHDLRSRVYYIDTNDVSSVKTSLSEATSTGIMFDGDRAMIKTSYIMDMLVAVLLLIVSICLIIVSFVVLRFTISFTISEEFREIGVMKAMGIKNNSIRSLYLTKYVAIAVIGAVIGYIASLPLGNKLLEMVSRDIMFTSDNKTFMGILSSIAVILLIVFFSWSSTAKIKKLSPIDAVRSGQTGERFRKKSLFRLSRSRLGTSGYLAVNDVASSPKNFSIITAVFTICALLIMMIGTLANTLCSSKMLYLFSVTDSDIFINNTSVLFDLVSGEKKRDEALSETEELIRSAGMEADVKIELFYKVAISHGDNRTLIHMLQCRETETSDYDYDEGTPPAYPNEIAITHMCADDLGVGIGDKVTVDIDGKKSEFIVTALYYSMIQMGESGRFHNDLELPDKLISAYYEIQADFTDSPSKSEISSRVEKLKDVFHDDVYDADEFVRRTAGVSDILDAMRNFVTILSIIVIALITILMERSFIAKEKSEIALMKAIGFRSSSIIGQHVLRFGIVSIIASLLAAVICKPVTQLAASPIFNMMGAGKSMSYNMSVTDVFLIYPFIIISATIAGAFFTALYTRTIRSSDTADIE